MLSVISKSYPTVLHAGTKKHMVKPSELDIYQEHEVIEVVQKPPYPAIIYENVSAARRSLTGMFSGLLTTHEKISEFFGSLNGKLTNVYTETLQDPYFLLTPGAIATAAVGGALLAGRGRRTIKRSFYAGVFALTATAASYPQRSLDIATTGYYHTSSAISNLVQSWRERSSNVTEKIAPKHENEPVEINEVDESILLSEPVVNNLMSKSTEEGEDDSTVMSEMTGETENIATSEVTMEAKLLTETTNDTEDIIQEELKIVTEEIITVDDSQESIELVVESDSESSETVDEAHNESNKIVAENDEHSSEIVEEDGNVYSEVISEGDNESTETLVVEPDYGQSNVEDKDMYSTRS